MSRLDVRSEADFNVALDRVFFISLVTALYYPPRKLLVYDEIR